MTSIPTLLRRSRTLSALLFSAAFPAAAEVDVFSLDLEQLLKTDITVTSVSNKEESLGRAAAAIHVLTAEEIRQSGPGPCRTCCGWSPASTWPKSTGAVGR
ncbi:MAG: hypothetical protein IPH01_03600 [Elusimicrobia bacterium]|nr:hypothetical protein [Elusimicrobiota bacterium]